MADRIITVTDPSIVTNDTLLGYNNYSDIDGQLGTTMTPTEATNGHTVALSDGVVHEVTTKPVGTTNGEFTSVVSNAVTVDLAGGTAYGLTFDALAEQAIQKSNAFSWSTDFNINFIMQSVPVDVGYIAGNTLSSGQAGFWGVDSNVGTMTLKVNNGSLLTDTTSAFSIGDKVTFKRVGDVFSIERNDVEEASVDATGFTSTALKFIIGGLDKDAANTYLSLSAPFNYLGEAFLLDEGTGAIATGQSATVLDLKTTTGSVDDIWAVF